MPPSAGFLSRRLLPTHRLGCGHAGSLELHRHIAFDLRTIGRLRHQDRLCPVFPAPILAVVEFRIDVRFFLGDLPIEHTGAQVQGQQTCGQNSQRMVPS